MFYLKSILKINRVRTLKKYIKFAKKIENKPNLKKNNCFFFSTWKAQRWFKLYKTDIEGLKIDIVTIASYDKIIFF